MDQQPSDNKTEIKSVSTEDADHILRSIEAMIWSIISGFNGLEHEDKNDLKQDILCYVYHDLIPKYQTNRGAKFSSFAYKCIVNYLRRRMYMRNRLSTLSSVSISEFYDRFGHGAQTTSARRAIERISALTDLMKKKKTPFSVKERVVIALLHDNLDITQREIASIMGYSHPSAVSMIVSRMRKKMKSEPIFQTL